MRNRAYLFSAVSVLVFLALVRPSAQSGMTPFFRMDCGTGGSAFPGCGAANVNTSNVNILYTRSFLAGGGPSGQDAVRLQLLGRPGPSGCSSQMMGWDFAAPTPPQGAKRYIRYRIRYSRITNIQACPGQLWGAKLVIINAAPDTERMIDIVTPHTSAMALQAAISKNINGVPDQTEPYVTMTAGTWVNIQEEIAISTTPTSGNGGYKYWADNNNYASPNGISRFTTSMTASAMGGVSFLQAVDVLASGESLTMDVCCLEYDDQFDPVWHQGGGTFVPPPTAPTNIRVIR